MIMRCHSLGSRKAPLIDMGIDTVVWPLRDLLGVGMSRKYIQQRLEAFECDRDDDVRVFLARSAIKDEVDGRVRTYLVLDAAKMKHMEVEIIAYFAVAITMSDYSAGSDEEDLRPAYLLAQFGRNSEYTHDDFNGERLLQNAEELVGDASRLVGGTVLYLDCKPGKMCEYYERHHYHFVTEFNVDGQEYRKYAKRID